MIDWSRVEELQKEFGEDGFADLVTLFLEEVEEGLSALAAASVDQLEAQFHFLKGSALNMGMTDLAQHCQSAESAAKAGALSDEVLQAAGIFAQSRHELLSRVGVA